MLRWYTDTQHNVYELKDPFSSGLSTYKSKTTDVTLPIGAKVGSESGDAEILDEVPRFSAGRMGWVVWWTAQRRFRHQVFGNPVGGSQFASIVLVVCSSGRVSLPSIVPPSLLKRIESMFPEATASPVNALRFATLRMMRNGAMTCSLP